MLITHEFPLQFYLDGTAESFTDYDYCLAHRYLNNENYRSFMKRQTTKGRIVYLDNSLYELGKAWNSEEYKDVIKDLNPTYYMLPDMFKNFEGNIKSQFTFYHKYGTTLKSKPIIIPHANSLSNPDDNLLLSISRLRECVPEGTMIAIPFADHSFENPDNCEEYFTRKDIPYIPLRQALNRKMFLSRHRFELANDKLHLLGCKSLAEFDIWDSDFDKRNIVSLDTSHPVAMTLENENSTYSEGVFTPIIGKDYMEEEVSRKYPMHQYKSPYLIDAHFEDYFKEDIYESLKGNIAYFQSYAKKWAS